MEIKTITINGLPLTKTVFEQIPEVDVLMFASKRFTVLGCVSYMPLKKVYVVGFSPDYGLVVTLFIDPDVLKKHLVSYISDHGFFTKDQHSCTFFTFTDLSYSLDVGPFVARDLLSGFNSILHSPAFSFSDRSVLLHSILDTVFGLLDSFKTSIDKIEQIFYT